MAKVRYEVVSARKVGEKTFWTKLGVVLVNDKGSFSLKLESIPVGWDGWAILSEPKPKEEKPAGHPADIESDIPF